jgi:decaprenyl-phosphate phosphoribosyltransferase
MPNGSAVDVMCTARGFVLRAVAAAIGVEPSTWLIICTITLCLFVGFCKRCNEIASLAGNGEGSQHRDTLASYTDSLLTHTCSRCLGWSPSSRS